jgi:endonuclease/exonuclease/phosphatase family metal-dependent hydrolase
MTIHAQLCAQRVLDLATGRAGRAAGLQTPAGAAGDRPAAVGGAVPWAAAKPHVLMGDFNFRPESAQYRLITRARLEPDAVTEAMGKTVAAVEPEAVCAREASGWAPVLGDGTPACAMRSAYAVALDGKEPPHTNHTVSGGGKGRTPNAFTGTLDYVFISRHWRVLGAVETPPATKPYPDHTSPLCPNRDEPSDHVMVGATLAF